ncbi:MAG: hypothetical protein JO134_12290 [Xanthobacteraceae bacterium]|nr:hypothetical protein [Xanthobacteraceae bacterium]
MQLPCSSECRFPPSADNEHVIYVSDVMYARDVPMNPCAPALRRFTRAVMYEGDVMYAE